MASRYSRKMTHHDDDLAFMKRALSLAEKGVGRTSPNPMVGAVLVRGGKILGEGFHAGAGKPHAEVEAIADALKRKQRIAGSTLYVTLEPCCHVGRTAPCTEANIAHGVTRVVFSTLDPDERVHGKGGRILRKAGLKVESGLCKEEAEQLLASYIHCKRERSPYIMAKLATSLDGSLATADGESKWITGHAARVAGRALRGAVDAVIVGSRTARADDPALTTRIRGMKNPYRIVVCGSTILSSRLQIYTSNADYKTILVVPKSLCERYRNIESHHGVAVWGCQADRKGMIDPSSLVTKCWDFGFRSLLVEGGASLIASFLKAELIHEWRQYVSGKIIGGGKHSVAQFTQQKLALRPRLAISAINLYGDDIELAGKVEYQR